MAGKNTGAEDHFAKLSLTVSPLGDNRHDFASIKPQVRNWLNDPLNKRAVDSAEETSGRSVPR